MTRSFEIILFFLCSALFLIAPLFYMELKQDQLVEGFIPIRMVNAELKLSVFILLGSLVSGMIWIKINLQNKFNSYANPFLVFTGIFIASVCVSTVTAHNIERAWVYSFAWHILPALLAISLYQLKWTPIKLNIFISALIIGGVASCLIVMDQHYKWTDWSHKLPRTGYGGLIYNQNFAAEYHAPLLPLSLGLLLFVQSRIIRAFIFATLIFVLLPAISLSLARGAWVGLMGGCAIPGIIFLLIMFFKRLENEIFPKDFFVPGSFLILALALPFYLYTSNFWKKDAFSKEYNDQSSTTELKELKSIFDRNTDASGGVKRRLVLWQDAIGASLNGDLLWGKGTDHYELHFHESAKLSDQTTGSTLVRFVHNDFLQILYENGIIGLVGFLGMWGVVLSRGINASLRSLKKKNRSDLGLLIGLLAGCLTFLIESLFEFPTRSPCALIVGWMCFGLLLARSSKDPNAFNVTIGPKANLVIGSLAIFVMAYGCFLSKNLFFSNIYHFQGRIAGDYGQKDKSLKFHKESISLAPWEHHSRKFESFYLLTHKKHFHEALESINKTIQVHPGCLVAHQNKISVLLNEFKDRNQALQAYREMKKIAPYHPYTKNESMKFAEDVR